MINRALTVLLVVLIAAALVPFVQWALIDAVWRPDANACRAAHGACWGFIAEKHRFILFGTYPFDEQWRPALSSLLFLALWVLSAFRRAWRPWLVLIWVVGLCVIGVLMWGGVLGLAFVFEGYSFTIAFKAFQTERGNLTIWQSIETSKDPTTYTVLFEDAAADPRHVEQVVDQPLISLLFMASVMLPLFLPGGVSIDKLLRAQIALILFAAAYLAEVVRGGLQAIPRAQYEAADALGLSYWQSTFSVVLPQALRIAVPPLTNTFIGFFKDTSLVLIIGLFDLLSTIKVSLTEPAWSGFGVEAYLFAALVYFLFCFALSRYSRRFEHKSASGSDFQREPA